MNNKKTLVIKNILLLMFICGFCVSNAQIDNDLFSIRFKTYNYERFNQVVKQQDYAFTTDRVLQFGDSKWKIDFHNLKVNEDQVVYDCEVILECVSGSVNESSVSIVFPMDTWEDSNFVLMPAALYNGNKYEYRRIRYSPKLLDPRDIGLDVPILLTDVPRLNYTDGPSRVQLRSGATTSPSMSYYDSIHKKGFILLTEQGNDFGDFGLEIEEFRNKTKAEFSITSPLVRELHQYYSNDNLAPSKDKAANFKMGDKVSFRFKVYDFELNSVQGLFNKFSEVRKNLHENQTYNNVIPMSEAFNILEEKFKKENWVDIDNDGYFAVGMRENFLQDFQTGWVGGMITTFPLLNDGAEETKDLVVKNFNWFFPNSTAPSGLFYGFCENGTHWFGGDNRKYHTKNWLLTRKSADAIFYISSQLELFKKQNRPINQEWEEGLETACDAFVNVWKRNKQIGQFIDANTGEIQVGGSSSAGILPAGLVLASNYFKNPEYLKAALDIGQYFYTEFTQKGISCGGPGDAMQNFDSESAYGLVESYYALYEATNDKKWELAAMEAAKQFATWVIAYNYKFPENSTFYKLGNQSVGGVWANTQNTHGSPGICTHSGLALLKLYRSTGDTFYAHLLSDITHAIPQCLSMDSRKVMGAPHGWMSERLSTTDWNEGIGEIFVGSTWAETAMMLTYSQIPGLYVCVEKSEVIVFDNVEVEVLKETRNTMTVKITNPTNFDAKVKVWEEDAKEQNTFLDQNYLYGAKEILVPQRSSIKKVFKK